MAREEFTIQGMTGVDLSLQIAGPGARSYAFIIDWHIRLVLALIWLYGATLSTGTGLQLGAKAGAWTSALVGVPAIIIYFLYHPIVELLMRGQTPGKRMAGVRVINREGGPPGTGSILIRNAFRLVDSMPVFYALGLICTFVTAQRVRVGDMAAGTLLVMNETGTGKSMEHLARGQGGLDPATQDLVEQLLERWNQLGGEKRRSIARALLQRIDTTHPRLPDAMNDADLHERLLTLSDTGKPQ